MSFRPGKDRSPGFSLAELIVALGIMGLALLVLFSVLATGNRSQRKMQDEDAAYRLADQEMSRLIYSLENDSPPGVKASFWASDFPPSGPSWRGSKVQFNRTDYDYQIHTETLLDTTSGVPLGAPGGQLKLIHVAVSWWKGQNFGQTLITVRRLVRQ